MAKFVFAPVISHPERNILAILAELMLFGLRWHVNLLIPFSTVTETDIPKLWFDSFLLLYLKIHFIASGQRNTLQTFGGSKLSKSAVFQIAVPRGLQMEMAR